MSWNQKKANDVKREEKKVAPAAALALAYQIAH